MGLLILSVLLLLGTLLWAFWYVKFFDPVHVHEQIVGPYTVMYKEYTGDYTNTGPIQMEIYEELKKQGIETSKTFGVYYDDPKKTPKSQRRCITGCILEGDQMSEADKLHTAYGIKTLPRMEALVVEFPFVNALSLFAGVSRAYPALQKEAQEKGIKTGYSLEIYDMLAKKISYILQKS